MMYQLPAGARDLLPLDVAQKRWIEDRLRDVFKAWGYHRIITPTLERMETLTAGGAVKPESVIQVWDAEEGVYLGLRPELTASIARAAVTRMSGVTYPQRLYYVANIFRRQPVGNATGQHEFFQAGLELLGSPGLLANAEVLMLLGESLQQLGLDRWHLVLGDARLTRSLLDSFPITQRQGVREAMATLNEIALKDLPLDSEQQARALAMMNLRGSPEQVLGELHQWPLDETQAAIVHNLEALIALVTNHAQVTLDLSLLQTYDYYTGIVFDVVSENGQKVLAQGGRYDELLSSYHPEGKTIPGIGFSMNIQEIHHILQTKAVLPTQIRKSHVLVVPETPAATHWVFQQAAQLRSAQQRVEIELMARSPQDSLAYAKAREIGKIAWVNDQGSVKIETLE
ncbi:ATP phosphoribosyltransferase regulatory subunit [Lyngbya confervoides]|uniref:ATP phosphoribosyltransferase regulatory subunit n=1 Tax=Lyngbya confervoides BDU141951 TaxID=1574623 RepID=A0ABD4SYY1_9CYAN|nr:ATP phosphoribosyltransferase regulatory subunit [Lyngbya confervoides]MCM1981479.1 ATP phosphoribosyltransferase regulatory subunit [Lyngbya confervoides BDU141951]